MVAELAPGPGFEEFLEGADAPGQRQEGVGPFGHQALALVHGVDDQQFRAAAVRVLAFHQRARDHAHHPAAGGQRGVGHHAHQAAATTAVDQLAAVRADPSADLIRHFGEGGVCAGP